MTYPQLPFPEEEDRALTLRKYQRLAWSLRRSRRNLDDPASRCDAVTYFLLALCGESGEAANTWKKVLRDTPYQMPDEDTRRDLIRELGDVLWYLAAAADAIGADLEEVARVNLAKLRERYGEPEDTGK